jgi:aryl-alcohol dehydrogenase-like predicted oxidoreductase
MEYVKLGRTDVMVSRCCLGTMTWGSQNTEARPTPRWTTR